MNINNFFDTLAKIVSDRENAEVKISFTVNEAGGILEKERKNGQKEVHSTIVK